MANKKIKYQTIGTSSLIDPSNKPDFVTPGGAGTSSTINTVDPFAVVNKQMQQGVYGDFLSSPPPSPKWSHQVGQTITGVDYDSYSKYIDQPFSFITDDPDQLRAQGQSVGEKFKYMLPKLVTRVGTNVAGSTVGLLYGGGSFLSALADNNPETNPNKAFWDNSFQRGLDGINDWMDDKLPHYYTKEEQEYGFFKSAFGPGAANFWMNDFTQGLSFVVGAVLTESLVRGMGQSNYMNKAKSLFSKKGRVPYKENTATITQTAQATQNLSRWDEVRGGMLTLRQLGTGAMYEASVEARHHYDRTLEGLVQMHKEQHNGMSPNTKEMAYLVDLATKSGNAVWAGNVALVGYGNYLLFPKIFGRGYNSSKSIFGQVGEELTSKGTKYINLMTAIGRKEAIARNAWSVLRLPLYEGFVEEGGQKLLDLSGQHAAEDFYLAKKDPTYLSMVDELIASTDDTFSEAYGSAEGQKEIGIGFLLAAIGLPGRKSTTGKDGKTTKKFGMLGGAYSSYNDMKMQDKTVDNLVEILNNGGAVIDNLKANVDMMARAGKYQTIEDVAMLINSPMMKKNGEYNGLFLHIMTKLRVGLEQSLRDDVNEIKTMSVEDFREAFGWEATNDLNDEQLESHKDNVIDKMNKQIDLVKENWNRINGTFGTFGDDQKIMMTHALSISEHFDQREADMIEANEKAGLKSETETEVKTEQIRLERDRNEQISLLDRVKNIWNRLKPSKKEKILALPESVSVKQKRNIRSFTSPSHMEELFLELVTKIQALEAQIQSVENDSNISDVDETTTIKDKNGLDQSLTIPSSKKNQLQRLREELDVLLDRKIYLTKALNEGLDPELSRDEQSLLTEWQKRDPIKYAAEKDNVIKRLKDIRNIRAYRHRMIDMYNQMVQIESMSARENVTWNDKGTLIPRPEVMLMRMTADLENLSSNLTDKELGRVYERYNGKVISFNYVHQGEVTVKELRNFAKSNKLLAEIDKRAAEILQAETNTEIEAYIQALKEKNIPYNQENRTEKYTVFVKPETLQNENDRVLIRMPDFETIKKLRRKDLLEGMMGTNATAKEEYKRLVEELSLEKTSYTAYTLNMLKGATDIEVVDSNKVIENAISGIIETSEEQLKFEIEHTKNSLDKVKSELKDIVNLLSEFQTVNQSPESFSKKDKKGREYFTVNGVNYSLQGVANKIAEYTLSKRKSLPNGEVEIELSVVDNLKTQVETLEIELRSYKDDLNNFYNLESELSKSKTIESFQETVFTFMKEKWVGDQSLINELRKSNVFTDNPLMKSIWENMLQTEEGVDDATRVINNLVQTAQQNKALPEEISQLIDKELESIKREYEIVKTAADKLKTFLNINKDGTVSLRSKKETLQAYNEIVGEMVRLEKLLGRFSSDNIADELKVAILAANEAFAQRNRDYEKFQRLNQVLVGNLKFIIDTYNALRYGETQEIDSEQNPNTKEGEIIGRESMEAVLSDPKSNVYYYGTPITKHGFAKSASEHSLALKKEKDLRLSKEESPVDWSPKLEKELQFYAAINRFHKFTESLSNSNKDQYRLMFINRNTTPEDITDKVLFYNEKTKGFSYAKNIKKGLGTEQTEDIKIVITDKQGKPVIVKDKEGVDQIMYASVASSDVFIQFKKKGETITAYRYASEDLVPGTVKEIAYQGRAYFTGELTQDAIDTIEKHKIFRQGLLEVSGPRYIKISGTSNGMPIWVGGNIDHRAKASETIVQTEESVKNINLNIAVNSKNNIVEFENRKYNFKAGTAYVTKNGRLIPLHVDNLSQPHQNNIYNLLRLYAVQMVNAMNPNSKVNSKDSSYIHTINEQGDVVYAPEVAGKTIEQLLKSMIYFGKHAKNRAAKEYAIYQEGKYLYFGDQQLDINELANPSSVNQDSHAALRIFLSKLNYQINNATLKDDINARSSSRKNLGSELAKWKKKLNKAMSVKGYKMAEIKSLPKAKQTAFYQALHKWKKNNPKPTASDPEYNEYTEVVINDDLSFDFKNWSNYTEYLLGGTQGRSLLDIPFKLNLHKDKTNKNIDTSLTPQFLSVYVIWNKNATVSTLLTPEDLGKVEIQDTMAPKSNETEIVDTKINEEAAENSPEDLTVATDSGLVIGDVKTITHQAVGENPAWQVDFEVTGINPSTSSITVNVKKGVLLNADNTITELDLPSTEMLKAFIEQNLYLPEESGSKYAITNFEVEDETTGSTTDLNNLQRDSSPQLNITVDPEDSSSSGEKGGQAFNITMPHEEFELMDLSKEYETFKSMVPKNSNGSPIFNVSIVQGLVHGKNYGYFTTTGNILLSTESIKGTIYHETFHGITRRLLSPEQRAELYSEVKSITGKASTYKGEVKNLKSFTEKEADEWLAEEFRQYALLKGEYKVGSRVKKSLIQKIFDFIYKFFNSLSKNQSLFDNIYTGKYSGTIDNYTVYNIKDGAAMNASKIDAAAAKDINEAITSAVFDIALSTGIEFSQFFNFSKTNKSLETFLASIYGRPNLKGKTAYNKVRGDLEALYLNIENKITALSNKQLSEQEELLLQTYLLERTTIYNTAEAIRLDWNSFVKKHVKFLKKYKFDLNNQYLQDEISSLNEDSETGEVITKDIANYRSTNEVDPSSTISPELKLIIATLPKVQWTVGENNTKVFKFLTSKYGLNQLANYGQVLNTLYKNLSNVDTSAEMLAVLDILAEKDATYQVLLNRLGLSKLGGYSSYAGVLDQSLTNEEMKLLMSFLTSFKTTAKEYKILNVDTEQRRSLVNADQDNINAVIKSKWKAKFRQRLNTNFGVKNAEQRLVMDLNKKLSLNTQGKTITKPLGTEKG